MDTITQPFILRGADGVTLRRATTTEALDFVRDPQRFLVDGEKCTVDGSYSAMAAAQFIADWTGDYSVVNGATERTEDLRLLPAGELVDWINTAQYVADAAVERLAMALLILRGHRMEWEPQVGPTDIPPGI